MSTKPGEQLIDQATRDKVFLDLKTINQNNICIDCQKKNPKWTSIHLGIFLCLDCAGKHRQYGVVISFVKSVNLDAWNQKQILYMQKGGNTRALEYFRKRGIITANNRVIDYKSQIIKQYKDILTEQVQLQVIGGKKQKPVQLQKKDDNDFFKQHQNPKKFEEKQIEIPKAQIVQETAEKPKKKKEKKKIGAKLLNNIDFENLEFDDGVSAEQKNKIVKQYQKAKDKIQTNSNSETNNGSSAEVYTAPKIEQPKQLTEQQAKKKMQELKLQSNLKNISSQSFKDTTIDNVTLKQNLNKFSGATSISSSSFFNKEEETANPAIENIKGIVSNVGQNLYSKLSGYFNK